MYSLICIWFMIVTMHVFLICICFMIVSEIKNKQHTWLLSTFLSFVPLWSWNWWKLCCLPELGGVICYCKYEWTTVFMTFDLLVGGAVKWAWRTFWFAYFLRISSSLDGVRRRQASLCGLLLSASLVVTLLHTTQRFYTVGKILKCDRDGRDTLTMFTKWSIQQALFLVSKCFIFTSS